MPSGRRHLCDRYSGSFMPSAVKLLNAKFWWTEAFFFFVFSQTTWCSCFDSSTLAECNRWNIFVYFALFMFVFIYFLSSFLFYRLVILRHLCSLTCPSGTTKAFFFCICVVYLIIDPTYSLLTAAITMTKVVIKSPRQNRSMQSFYWKIPQLCAIPLWNGLTSTFIAYYADPNRVDRYPFLYNTQIYIDCK